MKLFHSMDELEAAPQAMRVADPQPFREALAALDPRFPQGQSDSHGTAHICATMHDMHLLIVSLECSCVCVCVCVCVCMHAHACVHACLIVSYETCLERSSMRMHALSATYQSHRLTTAD